MDKRHFQLILAALVLMIAPSGVALAECARGYVSIVDTNRIFSVFVPRSAGLGELSFDDIGCAVVARNEECATRQGMFDSGAVTYDHLTGAELPVEKAYFVIGSGVKTPGEYGVVAFKDRAEAERFGAGRGRIVKWFELVDEKLK